MSGIDRITEERKRQREQEKWSADHDSTHKQGELAIAAACYASPIPIKGRMYEPVAENCGCREACCPHSHIFPEMKEVWRDPWPWNKEWDKRKKHDRVKQLAIAGALIAAEIDRLENEKETAR